MNVIAKSPKHLSGMPGGMEKEKNVSECRIRVSLS
jgi:hypothetical protein